MSCQQPILWPSGAPTGATCGLADGHDDTCVDVQGQINPFESECGEMVRLLQHLDGELATPGRAHGQRAQNYGQGGGQMVFAEHESAALHAVLRGAKHMQLIRELKAYHGTFTRVSWESQRRLTLAFTPRGSVHGHEEDAKTVAKGGPNERKGSGAGTADPPRVIRQDVAEVWVRALMIFGPRLGEGTMASLTSGRSVALYDIALAFEPTLRDTIERVRKTAGTSTAQNALVTHKSTFVAAKLRAWQRLVPALTEYSAIRSERLVAAPLARRSEDQDRRKNMDERIDRLQAGQPARGRLRAPETKVFSDEEAAHIRALVADLQSGKTDAGTG